MTTRTVEPPPLETRLCVGPCGLEKPVTSFHSDGRGGRFTRCGVCRSDERLRLSGRTCVQCGAPLPRGRRSSSWTTCSRPCLLESVGLPPTFNAEWDLSRYRSTEREVRDTLDAVLMAVRGGSPK